MYCEHVTTQLDDYLNDQLSSSEANAIKNHLAGCLTCAEYFHDVQVMQKQLRLMPAPRLNVASERKILLRARPVANKRIFLTGFATAIAATMVLWLSFSASNVPFQGTSPLETVVLEIEEPRTIQLAFNVQSPVKNVRFKLALPEGISLQNRLGERAFSWSGQLKQGRNVLKLPLIGHKNTVGELVARIEQNGTSREFHVPMHVITRPINSSPFNLQNSTTM